MAKTLLTKKAINQLVKAKDTESIIKLYELERERNPFNLNKLEQNFSTLTHCQKSALEEQVRKGKTFGLAKDLYFELKYLLGLGRFIEDQEGRKCFIEYGDPKMPKLVYPF